MCTSKGAKHSLAFEGYFWDVYTFKMDTLYEKVCKPLFFRQDPEKAHEMALLALRVLAKTGPLPALMRRYNRAGDRPVRLFGIDFPNHVGVAAGFDKDAVAWHVLDAVGFGFVEIGTVTALKQPGNPRPRVFRIPAEEAVINRMGFPNEGAEIVAARLKSDLRWRKRHLPLGINIGKSKVVPIDQAAEDYTASFQAMADHADYVAVNVSSPNTPELRKLQGGNYLPELLGHLQKTNRDRAKKLGKEPLPLLLKIAPDLTYPEIDSILATIQDNGFSGIIATNTTIARPPRYKLPAETGGLSGRPLTRQSFDIVRYIGRRTCGKLPLIGCGGIRNTEDAGRLMDAGAHLVQIYTGMIYRGPFFAREIARALAWRRRDWV